MTDVNASLKKAVSILILLGLSSPLATATSRDQEQEMPDLAGLEVQLEQAFQAAVTLETDEPLWVMQAWGVVLEMATVLEQRRALAEGLSGAPRGAFEAAHERILQRWQELRPGSGRPELVRSLRLQDEEAKRSVILSLLDRYPGDFVIVTQAAQQYEGGGDSDAARRVLEAYLVRKPDSAAAYQRLIHLGEPNETRKAVLLELWQEATPGDPDLVVQWLSSSLPRQEPEATARLLSDFFDRRGTSKRDLDACKRVLQTQLTQFSPQADACLTRIARTPEIDDRTSTEAVQSVVARAARAGDWTELVAAVEELAPRDGAKALLAATAELKVPEQCSDILQLVSAARDLMGPDTSQTLAISAALGKCGRDPQARSGFLSLLSSVPEDMVYTVLNPWASQIQGLWRGDNVPNDARAVLEGRLRSSPESIPLLRTLDILYRLDDPESKHVDLLRRWQELPEPTHHFDGQRAIEVADSYLDSQQAEQAIRVLEWQTTRRFELEVAVALWTIYRTHTGSESANRYVEQLLGSDRDVRRTTGHLLRARTSLLNEQFDTALADYWRALEASHPNREIAKELLTVVALEGDSERSATAARRICQETPFAEGTTVETCALRLLSQVGIPQATVSLIKGGAEVLPEDIESLRTLAYSAQAVGDFETAERALRRAFDIDPRSENSWTLIANLLEKQGRVEELEAHLERARQVFSPPSVSLYRATARGLLAAGRPREAIDLLQEAKQTIPESKGGNWSRDWIDHEIRQAYLAVGANTSTRQGEPRSISSVPMTGSSGYLSNQETAVKELWTQAEALYSGSEGNYDPAFAIEIFEDLVALGDARADLRLALVFAFGPSDFRKEDAEIARRYERSIASVQERAQAGDALSQYLLGASLQDQRIGEAAPEAARGWLELAASQRIGWAWHSLGEMAEVGSALGGHQLAQALDAYRHASELGTTPSMISFARLVLAGPYTQETCDEAVRWLEKADAAGHPEAAPMLEPGAAGDPTTCLVTLGESSAVDTPPTRTVTTTMSK